MSLFIIYSIISIIGFHIRIIIRMIRFYLLTILALISIITRLRAIACTIDIAADPSINAFAFLRAVVAVPTFRTFYKNKDGINKTFVLSSYAIY